MFAWLWKWARPRQDESKYEAAVQPPPTSGSVVADASSDSDRSFLEQVESELGAIETLTPVEEQQVSALILKVLEYVRRTKIDPPIMPALAPRVLAVVNEPVVDIVQLSRLIEHDLAISAKLLSVANSAVFGGRTEVRTVREAINFLGTEQVAQVAIGLACSSLYERDAVGPGSPARWSRLFQHALATGYGAASLALRFGRSQSEQAFLGGLFHDVGKVVALRAIEALAHRGTLPELTDTVLDEALQRFHAYPGDEFYDKWTLPESLMTICAQHHQLDEIADAPPALYCVAVMSSLDTLLYGCPAEKRELMGGLRVSARKLALSDAQLRAAHSHAATLGERTQRMFEKRDQAARATTRRA
jgi:HD-like signal output (HDOD) protein